MLGLTLDNVVVDDIDPSNISASYADITLGPGAVNFTPAGSNVTVTNAVSGTSTPNACANKWVTPLARPGHRRASLTVRPPAQPLKRPVSPYRLGLRGVAPRLLLIGGST